MLSHSRASRFANIANACAYIFVDALQIHQQVRTQSYISKSAAMRGGGGIAKFIENHFQNGDDDDDGVRAVVRAVCVCVNRGVLTTCININAKQWKRFTRNKLASAVRRKHTPGPA